MTAHSHTDKWERITTYLSERFSEGEDIDLQGILFIIGIQELGQGFREFSKDEKMDLLHIALCALLTQKGYYTFVERDTDGWPHYEKSDTHPELSPKEQRQLVEDCIITYFEQHNVAF